MHFTNNYTHEVHENYYTQVLTRPSLWEELLKAAHLVNVEGDKAQPINYSEIKKGR